MSDVQKLEMIASELIKTFDVFMPPVPVEMILQNPKDEKKKKIDITQLSGSFLSLKSQYSPRMSLIRMLARHVIGCEWGKAKGLPELITNHEDAVKDFARMLIMPAFMLEDLTSSERNPTTMSMQFEVPEEDAVLRLEAWL